MTATLISLISIFFGIIGALITGSIFKKYSFGLTGNTILGVFGSILLIKSFGKLGINPTLIMQSGTVNYLQLTSNFIISLLGGGIAIIFMYKIINRVNQKE